MLGLGLGPGFGAGNQGGAAAAVRAMFLQGEQGAWFDPSDFSSLYQDAAGSTPVTALEQPVGLVLDKRFGLVRGPELVVNGDFANGITGWTTQNAAIDTSSGACSIINNNEGFAGRIQQNVLTPGKWYEVKLDIVSNISGASGAVSMGTARTGFGGGSGPRRYILQAAGHAAFQIDTNNTLLDRGVVLDNISVRELPGNHASQATAASRPVLSARVNRFNFSEDFTNPIWLKTDSTFSGGKLIEATSGGATAYHNLSQNITLIGVPTVMWLEAKAAERNELWIQVGGSTSRFNLATGVVTSSGIGHVPTIESVDDGYFRCQVFCASPTSVVNNFGIWNGAQQYQGVAGAGFFIRRGQHENATTPSRYQRVDTATDYDAVGFPVGLRFDGTDDSMATAAIDFSGTNKMTVWAGVRKLSDAALSIILETSAASGVGNPGSFNFYAPHVAAAQTYGVAVSGAGTTLSTFAAPSTDVLSCAYDLASVERASQIKPRVNGVVPTMTNTGAGVAATGNFGNYPLYIGRRAGTSLPFNGVFYGGIIRGAASNDSQIAAAEQFLKQRSGASF